MARSRAWRDVAMPCTTSASPICLPTRITGLSAAIGSWNTRPIPAPRTAHISRSEMASRSWPWKNTLPAAIRPGACTRRISENAVTDLPLPDSPTSPSVSPLRMSNDTSLTATSGAEPTSNTVVSPCTESSGSPSRAPWAPPAPSDAEGRRASVNGGLAEFAEHAPHGIRNLAHGRVGLHRGDDRRHEIVATLGGGLNRIERRAPCRRRSRRP